MGHHLVIDRFEGAVGAKSIARDVAVHFGRHDAIGCRGRGGQRVLTAGDMNLEGRVVYSTCAIGAPETARLISVKRAYHVHRVDRCQVDIRLSECTSAVSQNVSVRFSGVEDEGTDDVGISNEIEEGAWNWSDGQVVIQVAHDQHSCVS